MVAIYRLKNNLKLLWHASEFRYLVVWRKNSTFGLQYEWPHAHATNYQTKTGIPHTTIAVQLFAWTIQKTCFNKFRDVHIL